MTNDSPPPPLTSNVRLHQIAEQTILDVPPDRHRRLYRRLIAMSPVVAAGGAGMLALPVLTGAGGLMPLMIIGGTFTLFAACACVAIGLLQGREHTAFVIDGEGLWVNEQAWWGRRDLRWPRERITNVRCRHLPPHSGEPVKHELRIEIDGGKRHVAVLGGRSRDELAWIAAVLREELGIEAAEV